MPHELTPEDSERLKELGEALRSEFHDSTSSDYRQAALTDLEDLKPDFLTALKQTVKFSTNESLKARVAMWGYDRLLEQDKASKDPLADLLREIPTSSPPS